MKKILFVVLDTAVGGVSSSLSSLYDKVKDEYDISVLSLTYSSGANISYKNVIKHTSYFIDCYYSSYKSSSIVKKPIVLFMKMLRELFKLAKVDFGDVLSRYAIWKEERKNHYDTIVAFGEGPATVAVSYSRCNNTISWIHCDYITQSHLDEFRYFKNFKAIICVSKISLKHFNDRYPNFADRSLCVYNLMDDNNIRKLSLSKIRDVEYDKDLFQIVSLGRIDSVKRYSLIPQIASIIKKEGAKFMWLIIGPIRENSEFEKLQRNIEEYKVEDCVKWIGGRNNPYPYIKRSNLLVSLSKSEACPMVFNEARILNVPIVSADFPSSYEFIEDGENGLISSVNNIHRPIIKMISDEKYYTKIKDKSANAALDQNSIIKQINQLL